MNRIPVDTTALGSIRLLSSERRTDQERKPVLRDGIPVQRVSVLIEPEDRKEVLAIDIAQLEPLGFKEFTPVRVLNLTARP